MGKSRLNAQFNNERSNCFSYQNRTIQLNEYLNIAHPTTEFKSITSAVKSYTLNSEKYADALIKMAQLEKQILYLREERARKKYIVPLEKQLEKAETEVEKNEITERLTEAREKVKDYVLNSQTFITNNYTANVAETELNKFMDYFYPTDGIDAIRLERSFEIAKMWKPSLLNYEEAGTKIKNKIHKGYEKLTKIKGPSVEIAIEIVNRRQERYRHIQPRLTMASYSSAETQSQSSFHHLAEQVRVRSTISIDAPPPYDQFKPPSYDQAMKMKKVERNSGERV